MPYVTSQSGATWICPTNPNSLCKFFRLGLRISACTAAANPPLPGPNPPLTQKCPIPHGRNAFPPPSPCITCCNPHLSWLAQGLVPSRASQGTSFEPVQPAPKLAQRGFMDHLQLLGAGPWQMGIGLPVTPNPRCFTIQSRGGRVLTTEKWHVRSEPLALSLSALSLKKKNHSSSFP